MLTWPMLLSGIPAKNVRGNIYEINVHRMGPAEVGPYDELLQFAKPPNLYKMPVQVHHIVNGEHLHGTGWIYATGPCIVLAKGMHEQYHGRFSETIAEYGGRGMATPLCAPRSWSCTTTCSPSRRSGANCGPSRRASSPDRSSSRIPARFRRASPDYSRTNSPRIFLDKTETWLREDGSAAPNRTGIRGRAGVSMLRSPDNAPGRGCNPLRYRNYGQVSA